MTREWEEQCDDEYVGCQDDQIHDKSHLHEVGEAVAALAIYHHVCG